MICCQKNLDILVARGISLAGDKAIRQQIDRIVDQAQSVFAKAS